jgi:hypothetical protein
MTHHARAEDLPRVPDAAKPPRVRTLEEIRDTVAPPVGGGPQSAAHWFATRIETTDKMVPGSQHLAWLAAQRAITACELAQAAVADTIPGHGGKSHAMELLAVADQYRRIAKTCAERAGVVAPKTDDDTEQN